MNPKAESQVDLSSELAGLLARNTQFARKLGKQPVAVVAKGDGMYSGDGDYYLQVGVSAIEAIQQSLDAACVRPTDLQAILDYACGFGRVTRWLQAAFPAAQLHAADLDVRATEAVAALMGLQTMALTKDLSRDLPGRYDLVWIGSLFTHLADDETLKVLKFLRGHMAPGALLVATTHGAYVAERLRTREKTYNLAEPAVARLVGDYDARDSAFAAYAGQADYGISLIRPYKMAALAHAAGFDVVYFKARGWVKHQDCFGLRVRPAAGG